MNWTVWLEDWYASTCDGEREHQYGIEIATGNRQNWLVRVELQGLEVDLTPRLLRQQARSSTDWIRCWVEDQTFYGEGDALKLRAIVGVLRQLSDVLVSLRPEQAEPHSWTGTKRQSRSAVSGPTALPPKASTEVPRECDRLEWLERLLAALGPSMYVGKLRIETLDNPGWSVFMHGSEAEEGELCKFDRGADDWMMCRLRGGRFEGAGDPFKLTALLGQLARVTVPEQVF